MCFGKLKGRMLEMGFTQEKMAKKLGISVQSLNAKLNNRSQFILSEVVSLSNILEIENPEAIFFTDTVPKCNASKKED